MLPQVSERAQVRVTSSGQLPLAPVLSNIEGYFLSGTYLIRENKKGSSLLSMVLFHSIAHVALGCCK